MRTRFSIFLDSFLVSALAFLISFASIKVFISNNIICFGFAVIIFIVCIKLSLPKGLETWNKKLLSLKEEKHLEKCIFAFSIMKNEQILQFFEDLLAKNFKTERLKNYLLIDKKLILSPNFTDDQLSKRDILDAYIEAKNSKASEIAFFTFAPEKAVAEYAHNLPNIDIYFFSKTDTYSLMKKYNHFPKLLEQKAKQPFLSRFKHMSLNKKKARGFLFSSFILYFSSLFVPFSSYYLIFAGLSLILSVACFAIGDSTPISPKAECLLKNDN